MENRTLKKTRDERGATAIVVAISLLMLFGLVALGIDGSFAFDDRRGSQNAADVAALAAAWEACNPADSGTTPTAAAIAAAADNGYDVADGDLVTPEADKDNPLRWSVEIQTESGGIFGQATPYAPDSINVVSEATAECVDEPLFGGYALFAQATSCPGINEISVTGSTVQIVGNVHTNGDINTGANFDVDGEVTFRGENKISDSDTTATWHPGGPLDYPIDIEFTDYDPGETRAATAAAVGEYYDFDTTDITATEIVARTLGVLDGAGPGTGIQITRSGIYRTEGNVNLGKVTLASGVRVTFVALGTIKLTGESDLVGYDPIAGDDGPAMLLFSDFKPTGNKCNHNSIEVNSNGVTWSGVMFAPNGEVKISTSSVSALEGSIIAFRVNLSAADIAINFMDDPDRPLNLSVELVR
jgi:hypothetical protein